MCIRWLVWVLTYGFVMCGMVLGEEPSAPAPLHATETYSSSLWPAMTLRPAPIPTLKRPEPRLLDAALYTSIATYRVFDYRSTERVLAGGGREVELPQWVVANRGAFMAFEGLATATEVGGSVWLIRHRHRRMARAMNMVSIGLGAATVTHNYQQPLAAMPLSASR